VPELKLSLDNDGGIIAKGTFNSGDTLTTSGPGVRLIWYPRKGAFRAGGVGGGVAPADEWDDANIGDYSAAVGYDTEASGNFSAAMGCCSIASGGYSTAMGLASKASGFFSTAMGEGTTASEDFSTAMGQGTTASGYISTAMGKGTTASGAISTAMGEGTTASGVGSTAMGEFTRAQAFVSVAIGRYNVGGGTPDSWVATDPLFEIGIGTSGARANALTVLKNGNVGIDTTTPSEKLEVNGNAKIGGDLEVSGEVINRKNPFLDTRGIPLGNGDGWMVAGVNYDGNDVCSHYANSNCITVYTRCVMDGDSSDWEETGCNETAPKDCWWPSACDNSGKLDTSIVICNK